MTREFFKEGTARLVSILLVCILTISGFAVFSNPAGAVNPTEGAFKNNTNITAILNTTAPTTVNAGDTYVDMINITFFNNEGGHDILEYINVTILNYTNVAAVTLWNETGSDHSFDSAKDAFLAEPSKIAYSGNLAYANFTGLDIGLMNNTNMSVYVVFNISTTANHGEYINASILLDNMRMKNNGTGANVNLYPAYDTMIDNINMTTIIKTIAPTFIGPSKNNIGMLNITFSNNGGAHDMLEWINISILNITDVDAVSVWNETDHDSNFTTSGDTFMKNVDVSAILGPSGFANLTNLGMGILRYTSMSIYIAYNISSSATNGNLINASILPFMIKMKVKGAGETTAYYPTYDTEIDAIFPSILMVSTKDNDGDGKVETAYIEFSESIDDSSIVASQFFIGGVAASSYSTLGTPDDNKIEVYLADGVAGTDVKELTYTYAPDTTTDKAGNELASVGAIDIMEDDRASPVITSATTGDSNGNGYIDQYILTISENATVYSGFYEEISVAGYTVDVANSYQSSPTEVTVALVEGSDYDTGAVPDITYPSGAGSMVDNAPPMPIDIASGDLNDDTYPDIVLLNAMSGTLTVYLHNGVDAFATRTDYQAGIMKGNITIGDVNTDGLNDVVATDFYNDQIMVFLQNASNNRLLPAINYSAGSGPLGVAVGDLNDDERNDVVVANFWDGEIGVFIQDTSNALKAMVTYTAGSGPTDVTIGTLARTENWADVRYDVAVTNYNDDNIQLFRQTTGGVLTSVGTINTGKGPTGIASGDLNKDGWVDVAVANMDGNSVTVILQSASSWTNSALSATSSFNVDINTTDITIIDANNDGLNDIITSNRGNNTVVFHTQKNGGGFSFGWMESLSTTPHGITSDDFNLDGLFDIATAIPNSNMFTVLTQEPGDEAYDTRKDIHLGTNVLSYQPTSVDIGDINNDGYPDIVSTARQVGRISVLYGNPGGGYRDKVDYSTYNGNTWFEPWDVKIGDLNNDSLNDVAVTLYADNRIAVFTQNVSGLLNDPVFYNTGSYPYRLDIGDINSDGLNDVVVANRNNHNIGVFRQNKATNTLNSQATYSTGGSYPWGVTIGDVTGDGRNDIIITHEYPWITTYRMTLIKQKPDGTLDTYVRHEYQYNCVFYSVQIGDMNSDGRMDIIAGRQNSNQYVIWYQNALNQFGAGTYYSTSYSNVYDIIVTDINYDGKDDVVTISQSSDMVEVFGQTTNGMQNWGSYAVGDQPYGLDVKDVDGDGYKDIVTANYNGDGVGSLTILYQNPNSLGFSLGIRNSTLDYPRKMAKGDLNNDGLIDVAVVHQNAYGGSYYVSVFLQEPSGLFKPRVDYRIYGDTAYGIAIGDVNNDGLDDIVVSHYYQMSILTQKSDGTLNNYVNYWAYYYAYDVAIGDLNNDNRNDIAISTRNYLYVHWQSTTGSFNSYTNYQTGTNYHYGIDIGDLNNDTLNDVVLAAREYDRLEYWTQKSSGGLSGAYTLSTGDAPIDVRIADLDDDGLNDLIVACEGGSDEIYVFTQKASGGFDIPLYYSANNDPYGLDIVDFDDDGLLDIVAAEISSSTVSVFIQKTNGQFNNRMSISVYTNPWDVIVTDLGNDSVLDIITNHPNHDAVSTLAPIIDVGSDSSIKNYELGVNSLKQVSPGSITEVDGARPVFASAVTGNETMGNSTEYANIIAWFSEDINGSAINTPDFSVSGGVSVILAAEIAPGVVLLNTSTLNSSDTPVVSFVGNVDDLVGLFALSAGRTAVDGLRPSAVSAVTRDADLDGQIESYVITFNEDVFGTFNGSGFAVDGYIIDTVNSSQTGSNELTLGLLEKSSYDTGLLPDIAYSPGNLMDSNGNYLASVANIIEEDGAAPAEASMYVFQIFEDHPNLYAPDENTLFYNNTPGGLDASFTLRIQAGDNGNLGYARGEDAFGNTSVMDSTENSASLLWEYDLNYTINQGETKSNGLLSIWVYDLDGNNASDSISLVMDNTKPTTTMWTELGNDFVASFTPITLTGVDPAGIYKTYYQIDSDGWVEYTGPFTMSKSSGPHTLTYYSIDNINNTEDGNVQPVYIAEDWTGGVPGPGLYKDMVILGCNLTIDSDLIFENVTLLINNSLNDNPQWINVTNTGKFTVRNSTIRSINKNYRTRFIMNGTLDMLQTEVRDLWADPTTRVGGIEIYKSTATIDRSWINNASGAGIYANGVSPTLTDNTIWDSGLGILTIDGAATITGNTISDVNVGIVITNHTGAVTLTNNVISDANIGIYGKDLFKTDADFRITDNDFTNMADRAVFLDGSKSAISQLSIDNNTIESSKGGIWVEDMDIPMVYIGYNIIKNLTGANVGISSEYNFKSRIEQNDFTNSYGDGIHVRGHKDDVIVANNDFNGGTGIKFTHNAIGVYQGDGDVQIYNNNFNGVNNIDSIGTWENSNGTNIYVHDNTLTDSTYGGIRLMEYADDIIVRDNVIENNNYAIRAEHLEQDVNDTITILNNEVKNNTGVGISIDNINNIRIEDNFVYSNNGWGVELNNNIWGDVLIESNTIRENNNGLYIDSSIDLGQSIKNNSYINNNGWAVQTDFNPGTWNVYDRSTFVNNGVHFGGSRPDLVIHSGANMSVSGTSFTWFGDVDILDGGTLFAYDTTFQGTASNDFSVYGNIHYTSGYIQSYNEMYIEDPGQVDLRATTVRWNNANGIHLNNANISLQKVKLWYNGGNGMFVENSRPTIYQCSFYENDDHGLYGENFQGNISGSDFFYNYWDNIRLKNSAGMIYGNIIEGADSDNIRLINSGTTIKRNSIEDASNYGIYLDNSDAHILFNNNKYKIVSSWGWGTYTSRIAYNNYDDIYLYYSNPHIENNSILYSSKSGISMIYSGGHIEYNEIAWNTGNGIGKFNEKNPSIHDNYMHDNGDSPPNRAPSATGGLVSPTNTNYQSTVSITPVGWYDPDGDKPGFLYQWQRNVSGSWTNIAGATGSAMYLPTYNILGGDEIRCLLTPWDGELSGTPVNSSSAVIGNSAPSLDKVTISPTPAYDNSVLSAATGTFTDPDRTSTPTYFYQWYNQSGILSGKTSSSLQPANFKTNDTIYCIVIPNDGLVNGTAVKSSSVKIIHYVDPGKSVDDYDGDGVPDAADAFPYDSTQWADTDGDGLGDNQAGNNPDPDIDGDGVNNGQDAFPKDKSETKDSDGDGIGDNADQDDDNDGVLDSQDAFPFDKTQWRDTDGDGLGDNQTGNNPDPDIDGDGVANGLDAFPYDKTETTDSDGDGIGDNIDQDDDNDGYYDANDAFPKDNTEHSDNDNDGIGDNADTDDDNDGYLDTWESYLGTDNRSFSSQPKDTDGDKIPDGDSTNSQGWMDTDDDGDGYSDSAEKTAGTDPLDPSSYPGAPNRAPSITKVSISPTPSYDNSLLTAVPEGFSDPDGDTTQVYYYQWYVNDVVQSGQTKSFLSTTYFKANDTVYCKVTPSDGKDNGTAVKSNVVLIIHYTEPGTEPKDFDGDGYTDDNDAFPYDSTEWADMDGDGIGDNSDSDIDGDGYSNTDEIAAGSNPKNPNSIPGDMDGDGILDINDDDMDGDKVNNTNDAFPRDGTETKDSDGDGIGDNADQDDDNDGVLDSQDDFPLDDTETTDTDGDGIGDNSDSDIDGDGYSNTDEIAAGSNPKNPNSIPGDIDGDGILDINDNDMDGDKVNNSQDAFPRDSTETKDSDGDGIGDNADQDDDNDGHPDTNDDFPFDPNEWKDSDGDGKGDNSDTDRDGDGVDNDDDKFPDNPDEWADFDGDGLGDNSDPDDDNDGLPDIRDDFPYDGDEGKDLDGDGEGDETDPDDDGDGVLDENDDFPRDKDEWEDTDKDGIGNNKDIDDDNDLVPDFIDAFPTDPTQWRDTDGDGKGDNPDGTNPDDDIDGDGVPNDADDFPYDKDETTDTDGDGVGDNTDQDDDGDGVYDVNDAYPLDPSKTDKIGTAGSELAAGEEAATDPGLMALIMVMVIVLIVMALMYLAMRKQIGSEEVRSRESEGSRGRGGSPGNRERPDRVRPGQDRPKPERPKEVPPKKDDSSLGGSDRKALPPKRGGSVKKPPKGRK